MPTLVNNELNGKLTKTKIIKKALKIGGVISAIVLFLMIAIWGLFQLPFVQTYAAQKIANYYSKQLNTNISIKSVEIEFFNKLDLKELYIEDRHNDTLAYLQHMLLGVKVLDWEGQFLTANLEMKQPIINLHRLSTDTNFNYAFLIDYFVSDDIDTTKNLWKFELRDLDITDAAFHFHDYFKPDTSKHINYSHVDLSNFSFAASELYFKDQLLTVRIDSLSGIEDNGFDLKFLAANLKVNPEVMEFKNLYIQTEGSKLNADLRFTANSFSDYSSFNDLVHISSEFRNSLIHINDIAFFAPPLEGIKDQVYLDGKVNGTVSNLSGEEIALQLNNETFLKGNFDLRGLPDVKQTFVHLELTEFQTNAKSIRELPYPPFENDNHIKLPNYFDALGTIRFKGKFTGFYNDFVAYGTFLSALGSIKTDVSLKNMKDEIAYKGNFSANEFDLGSLFDIKDLSTVSLEAEIDGNGFTMESIDAKANGRIESLVYRDYTYRDITLNGKFAKETFEGNVVSTDRKLDFVFAGNIDFNKSKPVSKFRLNLKNANLGQLNLFNANDTATKLQFEADFNLEGKNIDNILGTVTIRELNYRDSKQIHKVDSFELSAENNANYRQLNLKSSLLDASIKGEFKIENLATDITSLVNSYVNDSAKKVIYLGTQKFKYQVNFKSSKPLFEVFIPALEVDSGTVLNGGFDNENGVFTLNLNGKKLNYKNSFLSDYKLIVASDSVKLNAILNSTTLKLAGINSINDFKLESSLSTGLNLNKISWNALNNNYNPAEINISNQMHSLNKMEAQLIDSYITINDSVWSMANENSIWIDSSTVQVSNINFSNANQNLELEGGISKDSTTTLELDLREIDLAFISGILPENSIELEGIAQGKIELQNVYSNLSMTSDIQLRDLVANSVTIGDAEFKSIWNSSIKAFEVNANLGKEKSEKLKLNGNIYPLRKKNSLDLDLYFNEFPINLFEPYVKDYITDIEGSLNGNIRVEGESSRPILRGKLQLQNSKMLVNYLNTRYTINDEIIVEPDFIGFNLIKIIDEQGNHAIATGTIFHENYSAFNLDIGLEFENFLSLNTNSLDNELYYGKAVTSGIANISGFADQLIFEIDLKAEKGTDFKIPLDEGVDISTSNFLVFTNSPNFDKSKLDVVDLSGIQLNFELSIDPEAKVQIIFDEQIGDIIKAQGEGNLNLEINTLGNFNIYGQYVVEKGDYLFTLKNVVNKRFELVKGSRIFWDGNPYKAQVDMKAIYNLRAPLYDLFPEDTSSGYRRRIPVELELQMSDQLMSPEIGFDIRLPTADENTKRRLESILYVNNNDVNPQEMNQQVFGLLVLNRFMPSTSSDGDKANYDRGAPGINNGYEFLSNQLSNWFSQISDDFDVGVNYRPANDLNSEEVDLSLSTEILNDRLILDGNLGYTGNGPQYNQNQNSSFVGEFTAEYKLSRDGRFRVKGFNRSMNNSLTQVLSPYTQGIGLFYREEFETFGELFRKYFHAKDE